MGHAEGLQLPIPSKKCGTWLATETHQMGRAAKTLIISLPNTLGYNKEVSSDDAVGHGLGTALAGRGPEQWLGIWNHAARLICLPWLLQAERA